jgi:hypothetical protein
MKLEFFKTLWGWSGPYAEAVRQVRAAGFAGVEGPLPQDAARQKEFLQALEEGGVAWIAEISTTGYAVAAAGSTVQDHLEVLRREILRARPHHPRFFTSMAGNDLWSVAQSVEFYGAAVELARELEVTLYGETHRGRSLFHPRVTLEILRQVPELQLTADFSHWCVVCERLVLDDGPEFLDAVVPHVRHFHGRVGYDQGAQIPHPSLPRYAEAVAAHLRWWKAVWQARAAAGADCLTCTPEFGPDGYQQVEASTDQAYGDLWEINQTMAGLIRRELCPA